MSEYDIWDLLLKLSVKEDEIAALRAEKDARIKFLEQEAAKVKADAIGCASIMAQNELGRLKAEIDARDIKILRLQELAGDTFVDCCVAQTKAKQPLRNCPTDLLIEELQGRGMFPNPGAGINALEGQK